MRSAPPLNVRTRCETIAPPHLPRAKRGLRESGDQDRPAAFLLGKNVKPAADYVCQGDLLQVAHKN
jgi:hypothetical protein